MTLGSNSGGGGGGGDSNVNRDSTTRPEKRWPIFSTKYRFFEKNIKK